MTMPGIPMVTYGDEIGMRGDFGEDGRRPMPWDENHWDERLLEVYRGLIAGKGRSAALRDVQLAMRRRADRAHPFYWAAFVFAGDWGAMRGL